MEVVCDSFREAMEFDRIVIAQRFLFSDCYQRSQRLDLEIFLLVHSASNSVNALNHECCKVCGHGVDNDGHCGDGKQSVNDEDRSPCFAGGSEVAKADSKKKDVAEI